MAALRLVPLDVGLTFCIILTCRNVLLRGVRFKVVLHARLRVMKCAASGSRQG